MDPDVLPLRSMRHRILAGLPTVVDLGALCYSPSFPARWIRRPLRVHHRLL
ncbi:MAG: hypothetical protein M3325_12960 [Actinomycetota bacterium]|nr:hypothetical protein [Actinomycetota bacterium]